MLQLVHIMYHTYIPILVDFVSFEIDCTHFIYLLASNSYIAIISQPTYLYRHVLICYQIIQGALHCQPHKPQPVHRNAWDVPGELTLTPLSSTQPAPSLGTARTTRQPMPTRAHPGAHRAEGRISTRDEPMTASETWRPDRPLPRSLPPRSHATAPRTAAHRYKYAPTPPSTPSTELSTSGSDTASDLH